MRQELHRVPFPTTHWSLLFAANQRESAEGRRALDELLRRYLPALRAHLTAAKRMSIDEAEDVLQAFVADKFLEKNLTAGADRAKGKFRTLLLTALDRFVVSQFRRASAKRRAADRAAGDAFAIDPPSDDGVAMPTRQFEIAWAREVLMAALEGLRAECESSGRHDLWGVLEARVVRPILDDVPPLDYAALVQRFGIASPTAASNLLVTAKRMFARHLRAVVGQYATSPAHVDEEIMELRRVLAEGRAGFG